MLGAELVGLSRRMQRVRQQEQTRGWFGDLLRGFSRSFFSQFGAEHACLPSAVGVATEEDATGHEISEYGECIVQAGAITLGVTRPRRTIGPVLTIGEIAAQHDKPASAKVFAKAISKGAWQFDPAP